jgi:hypothetical protein
MHCASSVFAIISKQLAATLCKTKKPSRNLQERFGKSKNLPATCRRNQKTFPQLAGAFRKIEKPSRNLQELRICYR